MEFFFIYNIKNIFEKRRSIHNLGNKLPITDTQPENILKTAITYVPRSFNSQSSELVLLLNQSHLKLWNKITLNSLKKTIPDLNIEKTKIKL